MLGKGTNVESFRELIEGDAVEIDSSATILPTRQVKVQ